LDVIAVHLIQLVRRMPGTVIALLAIATVMVISSPARSVVSGTVGNVDVSVTPTTRLVDGQALTIHAEAHPGVTMYDVQVHLCKGGAGVQNGFEFDFDGPNCSPSAVSPNADSVARQAIAPGTSAADLTFRVGVGTGQPWDEYLGGSHTLTCGPDAPCDLVVQIAVLNGNVFFEVPLCFGPACAAEPVAVAAVPSGSEPKSAAPAASNDTGATGGEGGTSGGWAPSRVTGSQTGSGGSTTAGASTRAASQAGSSGTAGAGDVSGSGTQLASGAAGFAAPPSPEGWRLFLAGIAGLLCGARIVMIVARARRTVAAPA
jgi:hypothetical protein